MFRSRRKPSFTSPQFRNRSPRRPLFPAVQVAVSSAALESGVGLYQFGQDFAPNPGVIAEVKSDGPWLVLFVGRGGGASYLIPIGENRFIDRAYGGLVRFVKDAEGRTTELIWNFGRDYRAVRLH